MASRQFSAKLMLFSIVALFYFSIAWSQAGYYFGQNKVQYKNFKWKVFRSEHFDVHYYPEAEQAAYDAARMAERGYVYLSEILDYQVSERIPLILYASLNDFQQTNVVQGFIGEGTRGVTEGLQNRVVLPITGSYRDFNHVLVHELVHAFQFDLMLRSKLQKGKFNPPLWFVEGMAEYLSIGLQNTTRMWVRDGLLNDKLLTIQQLNTTFDIRVYRLGESLWHFIGERYGKKKIGELFKSAIVLGTFEAAVKTQLGLSLEELTKAWHEYSRELVFPEDSTLYATLQKPEDIAEKLTDQKSFFHRINLVPAVSPDGKHIVYIANQNLSDAIYMLSEDENGRLKSEQLLKGGSSTGFEALRFFDTGINWSLDGRRITFISKSGKNDVLYIMDPYEKEIINKFVFKELNGLLSPAFSPEGDQIVFVGISGGISDLYILNLKDESLSRLTDDRFTVFHPQWSPKGDKIVFSSDRGEGTLERQLLFGDYDLAIYHLESKETEVVTHLNGNATSPQWSPDASEIAFVSDHLGIPNIYRLNLKTGQVTQMTFLRNGVAGITETTPSLSWSADGRYMVFSAFENSSWQLYRKDLYQPRIEIGQAAGIEVYNQPQVAETPQVSEDSGNTPGSSGKVYTVEPLAIDDEQTASPGPGSAQEAAHQTTGGMVAESAPAKADPVIPSVPDPNTFYDDYPLANADSIEQRNYSGKFRLQGVAAGASVGGFFGAVGQAQFLFSDLLGNKYLIISSGLTFNQILHSDIGVTYFNQGSRINYGLQAFQFSNRFTAFATFNSLGTVRNTYRGFNALIAYPFNRFVRLELTGGLTWVDQDVIEETFFFGGSDRQTTDITTFNFAQTGAALVFDNTVYGLIGPIAGSRSRFSVETTFNDLQFTNLFVDYRRYFNIGIRSTIAWRFLGGTSLGRDQQIFRLGGPYSFRGTNDADLIGPNFLISNLEYRFPLFFFLPPQYDFLTGVSFLDLGSAWGIQIPGFSSKEFKPFSTENSFRLNDLKAAAGFGLRLNLGILLGFDIAWPTDLRQFGKPVTLFSIGSFF